MTDALALLPEPHRSVLRLIAARSRRRIALELGLDAAAEAAVVAEILDLLWKARDA